jgi:2-(1,2-epoxy-1,2-dihydrophenyl)acetyl-CoA isomerase
LGDVRFFKQSLKRLAAGDHQPLREIFNEVHGTIRTMHQLPKPIVASVHGAVAGFGISFLAACDLAIAADDTVFTMAYCHIGTSPDGGSTFALPRTIGLKRSMELALLGDRFDANQALRLGLINWVVPGGDLRAQTEQLAARLAAGPTKAYAKTRMLLNTSLDADLNQQLDREQAAFLECATSDDFAEGVSAFLDKRRPRFRGR